MQKLDLLAELRYTLYSIFLMYLWYDPTFQQLNIGMAHYTSKNK